MDTWTIELTLKRKGRKNLENIKYVRMDGLTTQKQNISLRRVTAKMTEDLISYLNHENDTFPRCENCGEEYVRRLMGDEYYLYCPSCGMGEVDNEGN